MSNTGPVSAGPPPFQVAEIVGRSFKFLFQNISTLIFLGAMPVIVIAGLTIVGELLHSDGGSAFWHLGANLILLYVLASFAVSWHRYVLLGEVSKRHVLELGFGAREARFFLYSLIPAAPGLLLGVLALALPPDKLTGPFVLLFALQIILLLRLAMLFPAISLEEDRGVGAAWQMLTGTSWRLFLAWLLATMPLALLSLPLVSVSAAIIGDVVLANQIVGSLLEMLAFPLVLTIVSFVYQSVSAPQPPPPSDT